MTIAQQSYAESLADESGSACHEDLHCFAHLETRWCAQLQFSDSNPSLNLFN